MLRIQPAAAFEGVNNEGELDRIHRCSGSVDVHHITNRWDNTEKSMSAS